MKIGMIHQRTGGMDGVALEMDKWSSVLSDIGHEVVYCTGEGPGYLIPELHLLNEDESRILDTAFYKRDGNREETEDLLQKRISVIKPLIEKFLDEEAIDLLIIQNIWAVVSHIGTAAALAQIVQERNLPACGHHHDFFWDAKEPFESPFPEVTAWFDLFFPPDLPTLRHFVINSDERQKLMARRSIESTIVPNVIDPETVRRECPAEEHTAFRKAVGAGPNDLIVMCGTRIIPHKYIEAALDIVLAMNRPQSRRILEGTEVTGGGTFGADSSIVFVATGRPEAFSEWYLDALRQKALDIGVEARWIGPRVSGMTPRTGEDLGRLFDIYCHADLVTYTTYHEGWGNQLLEGLAAAKPMVAFEYPVFVSDIAGYGFDLVSMGRNVPRQKDASGLLVTPDGVCQNAAVQAARLLSDRDEINRVTQRNLDIVKRHLSFDALRRILSSALERQ